MRSTRFSKLSALSMSRQYKMRDLWSCEQQPGDSSLEVALAPHAIAMYRISAR